MNSSIPSARVLELIIQGKSEGEATITIVATEPSDTDADTDTDLEQWATQTILVRVTRN